MKSEDFLSMLKAEVVPALGCTEPVAVALVAATARQILNKPVVKAEVSVSPNIYKNGMRVGIPGTSGIGLEIAVAMGIMCGDANAGLEVLKNATKEDSLKAELLVRSGGIKVVTARDRVEFFIHVVLTDQDGGVAICIAENRHTNITHLSHNGVEKPLVVQKGSNFLTNLRTQLANSNIKEILGFIETVDSESIAFLLDGRKMNMEMADYGLTHDCGLGLGRRFQSMMQDGTMANDVVNKVKMYTCAACDARMAGVSKPVMSSAGSGNHGLTAIIPVVIASQDLQVSDERLARALALSHLITSYVKCYTGRLSPVCGCSIAAGLGASCAIVWLYGGNYEQISHVVQNIAGTITGMICDGAKGGCSLKLATAAAEAYIQARLAVSGVVINYDDGIVGADGDKTIQNMGAICNRGMEGMDKEIIRIMCE